MRIILPISLVLNAALAVVLWVWMKPGGRQAPRVARAPVMSNAVANTFRIIKTNVLVRPRAFTWQEVEADDYSTYVQNLRALGMPETTIRDIIIADVDQLFAQKRRDDTAKQDIEWWRSEPSDEYRSNTVARAQALETERSALLTRLLGPGWQTTRLDQQPDPLALPGPILGSLPEDVKHTVQEIAARSIEKMRDYFGARDASGEAIDPLAVARMREETRQQLAAVLSPQQLEEFLVRYSDNANRLRRELAGLELGPEEFRRLFRSIDSIDRDLQLRASGDDPASQRQRQALEQQRVAAIHDVIGKERFEAYQMLRDPEYQRALAAVQEAGANIEAATALYEISRATTDELNRIRNDPTLTVSERQQQLRETEIEQLRARALVLGEEPSAETSAPQQISVPTARPHVIEPGQTLGQISLRYGVRINEIREANPGVDINRLPPGAVINVPPTTIAPPPLPPAPIRR